MQNFVNKNGVPGVTVLLQVKVVSDANTFNVNRRWTGCVLDVRVVAEHFVFGSLQPDGSHGTTGALVRTNAQCRKLVTSVTV